MGNFKNLLHVTYYEVLLLSRGWLWWIFVFCILVGIGALQWNVQGGEWSIWPNIAMASSIPLLNAWLYNIFQSFFVIFLGVEFVWRDRMFTTNDVIRSRPVTNTSYLTGKIFAVMAGCLAVGIVSVLIGYGIYLLGASPRGMFRAWYPVFYLVTLVLPTMVFWVGVALLLSRFILSRGLYLTISLGLFALFFLKGDDLLFGAIDPWGRENTYFFSSVTYFPRLSSYLLQRLTFLLLGVGLSLVSIHFTRRLSDRGAREKLPGKMGSIFIVAGVTCCVVYGISCLQEARARTLYREIYSLYSGYPEVHVSRNDLRVKRVSDSLHVASDLILVNQQVIPIDTPLLYLNPGLEINVLTVGGKPVSYSRNRQALRLNYSLLPEDSVCLHVEYKGRIDDRVCYPEIECPRSRDSLGVGNRTFTRDIFRDARDFCVVSDEFTFLLPECLWYPVARPPVDVASPLVARFDFTQFSLHVEARWGETILSQGQGKKGEGKVVYTSENPLPKLSLCIGHYERERVQAGGVEMELYYFKGHDFWRENTGLDREVIADVSREMLSRLGESYEGGYPYERFRVVEIPGNLTSFRRLGLKTDEFVQPEILFVPEQNKNNLYTRFKQFEAWYPDFGRKQLFDMYLGSNFFFNISPMFNEYQGYIFSDTYLGIGELIQNLRSQEGYGALAEMYEGDGNDKQLASSYFRENGIKEVFTDNSLSVPEMHSLLKILFTQVQKDIFTRVSREEFCSFTSDFMRQYSYTSVDFHEFNAHFKEKFGWSLEEVIKPYYEQKGLPVLLVRDMRRERLQDKIIGSCKVYNPSERDGVLSVLGFTPVGGREAVVYNYIIPAKSCKEVRSNLIKSVFYLVSTNLSECLPWNHSSREVMKTSDERVGVFDADSAVFNETRGVVVDNEDPGFVVRQQERHKQLSHLLRARSDRKYCGSTTEAGKERWTLVLGPECYGGKIRSAYMKKAGTGESEVEWKTEILKKGRYEIMVYLPESGGNDIGVFLKGAELNYRVEAEGINETICLKLDELEGGWSSLGVHQLVPGVCRVILNDKGGDVEQYKNFNRIQNIIADAVKWMEVKDKIE